MRRGAALTRVQVLLGHATIEMTMRYVHLVDSDLDEAIAVLEPAFNPTPTLGQRVGNAPPPAPAPAQRVPQHFPLGLATIPR